MKAQPFSKLRLRDVFGSFDRAVGDKARRAPVHAVEFGPAPAVAFSPARAAVCAPARAVAFGLAFVSLVTFAASVSAEDFFVPSFATPTIQDAVDDAALNADPENTIYLGAAVLFENVSIGGDFNVGHQLTLCPDGNVGLTRATVSAFLSNVPVFTLTAAIGSGEGYVTLQDLDIVRTISGSASHLVSITGATRVIVERCRIGLNWTTPGPNGYSNLWMSYPTEVIVRNCIFFSRTLGNFDHAVYVAGMADPENSVLLYNNLAADYRLSGYRISDGAAPPTAYVLLRNNIAVNHLALAPEPFGYRSEVDDAAIISSHNVVFASAGFQESVALGASTIGNAAGFGLQFPRAAAPLAFVTNDWVLAPPWNANPAFFRLQPAGPLHDVAADWGVTVIDGAPDPRDVANVLDIHREGRPSGGTTSHTDRGPDQVDVAPATGIEDAHLLGDGATSAGGLLTVAPLENPTRDVALAFTSKRGGTLTLELFDIHGRSVAKETLEVTPDVSGTWHAADAAVGASGGAASFATAGVQFYRAILRTTDGDLVLRSGKVIALR